MALTLTRKKPAANLPEIDQEMTALVERLMDLEEQRRAALGFSPLSEFMEPTAGPNPLYVPALLKRLTSGREPVPGWVLERRVQLMFQLEQAKRVLATAKQERDRWEHDYAQLHQEHSAGGNWQEGPAGLEFVPRQRVTADEMVMTQFGEVRMTANSLEKRRQEFREQITRAESNVLHVQNQLETLNMEAKTEVGGWVRYETETLADAARAYGRAIACLTALRKSLYSDYRVLCEAADHRNRGLMQPVDVPKPTPRPTLADYPQKGQ